MVLLVLPRTPRLITTITQHEDDVLYCSPRLSDGSSIHDLSYSGSFDGTSMKMVFCIIVSGCAVIAAVFLIRVFLMIRQMLIDDTRYY
jgi:hypothetical protein